MKKEMIKSGIFMFILILFGIFLISSASAATQNSSQVSYCCEKTLSGAYCQNSPIEQCDPKFRTTPTACESTSYCKKGCCYDSDQGICMENTPQEACKASNGVWGDSADCQIPQCNLGCCIMGQQAAYVPLARCKKLSALYGIQTDFRLGIADEVSCIALAQSQDKGACVYESDFISTCKFTTQADCQSGKLTSLTNGTSVKFYKDYLCTAPELNTNCQPLDKTTCVDGKNGVYFVDSCGNTANIYDSGKIYSSGKSNLDVIDYWSKIKTPDESCGSGKGNTGSSTCGNCDYLSGSTCVKADNSAKPKYGDYVCKDINCHKSSDGKDHLNGESWCYHDSSNAGTYGVGSRDFRHICVMGEEIVEPCADYRKEICIDNTIAGSNGGFSQAGCAVNRWQDCILQNKSGDCLNSDKRDCQWIPLDFLTGKKDSKSNSASGLLSGLFSSFSKNSNTLDQMRTQAFGDSENGKCVPKVSPGLQFWEQSSLDQCKLGSSNCIVKYEKPLIGQKKCVENCQCLELEAKYVANKICSSIGDCGANFNYIGQYVDKGYKISITKSDGKGSGKVQGNTGGSAQPGEAVTSAPPQASSQAFAGNQNQQVFAGSPAAQAAGSAPAGATTGNVIQGMIAKAINKVKGK